VGFGSGLRHRIDGFTVPRILQAQIKTHLVARFLAKTRIRAHDHEVRPQILADPRQALFSQAVNIGQRELNSHSRHTLRRDGPQFFTSRKLGGQPIR